MGAGRGVQSRRGARRDDRPEDLDLVAGHVCRPGAAHRENPPAGSSGPVGARHHRQAGAPRAHRRVTRDPSASMPAPLGFRLARGSTPPVVCAGRRRAGAAAVETRRGPGPSPPSSDGVNAERRAVEQRILWEAEAQSASSRPTIHGAPTAGRRGLARRVSHRRVTDRRAPSRDRLADCRSMLGGHRARGAASRGSICSTASMPARRISAATAGIGRPRV